MVTPLLLRVCHHCGLGRGVSIPYSLHDPSPIMDVSIGVHSGGVAIHALLGGKFSSPHKQATMFVTDQHWGKRVT